MSKKNIARRTELQVYFKGVNISKEISKYLISLSYTDNEEDKADDLTIELDDREGKWMKDWLNTSNKKTVSNLGEIVTFKGGPVYYTSNSQTASAKRNKSVCRVTNTNKAGKHPYHLISVNDPKNKVYGWVNASDIEGAENISSVSKNNTQKKAFKGAEIHAIIIQRNYLSDGKDKKHDCGKFEIDSVDFSGPPAKVSIKATSISYTSKLRQTKNNKAWENIRLKSIASSIAKKCNLKMMFLSDYNPFYNRKEQKKESDIVFLKNLCKKAGISLKVTSNTLVLFEAKKFEDKKEIKKIKAGKGNIISYKFSTKSVDTNYTKCTVEYTDPITKKKIKGSYTVPNAKEKDKNNQELKINEKVANTNEAKTLAKKYLRQKNKKETTAELTMIGDVDYCASSTVLLYGYGEFSGKYIIETATHNLTGGYKVTLKLRECLKGY